MAGPFQCPQLGWGMVRLDSNSVTFSISVIQIPNNRSVKAFPDLCVVCPSCGSPHPHTQFRSSKKTKTISRISQGVEDDTFCVINWHLYFSQGKVGLSKIQDSMISFAKSIEVLDVKK